eukprot:5906300-Amphidinium_carterae.1
MIIKTVPILCYFLFFGGVLNGLWLFLVSGFFCCCQFLLKEAALELLHSALMDPPHPLLGTFMSGHV